MACGMIPCGVSPMICIMAYTAPAEILPSTTNRIYRTALGRMVQYLEVSELDASSLDFHGPLQGCMRYSWLRNISVDHEATTNCHRSVEEVRTGLGEDEDGMSRPIFGMCCAVSRSDAEGEIYHVVGRASPDESSSPSRSHVALQYLCPDFLPVPVVAGDPRRGVTQLSTIEYYPYQRLAGHDTSPPWHHNFPPDSQTARQPDSTNSVAIDGWMKQLSMAFRLILHSVDHARLGVR
ncbi:predicted protein [Plenodomus lingam JN3]|uniref:Predicted protein n=1 Tax=Leptosphaeria maculans (strain JN3 / isolate v23.1.3 / race Av1-4-5-6-7-8) TaxID=985895 RepID=E4ZSN2_LEPMJ|nr:predicted protein [Plenodomus lingam JN3]CBX94412.1 predicted protein [Plenodomus lingam JN3]